MIRRVLAFAVLTAAACSSRSDSGGAVPWRTAFDSTGDTIVARTTGDVPNALVRRLVLEQKIGEAEGTDSVTFGRIGYVAITNDDGVFVFDEQGPSLKLFDSTGKLLRFVGRKGAGPGEFEQVAGMSTLPNNGLALWDASHARVNVYDVAGNFVQEWRVPVSGFFTTNALFTDGDTSVVLTLPLGERGAFSESGYVRFSATGALRDTIRIPRWVDSTPQLLGQQPNGQVMVSMRLPFAPTVQDSWNSNGALISGPSAPYVLYVTKPSRRPLKIIRSWEPVPTLPEERAESRESITWLIRLSLPDWQWPSTDLPSTKPAYSGFRTAQDGTIWVYVHSLAEKTEDATAPEASTPGLPPRPPQHYFEPNVFDVFGSDGAFLGRVMAARNEQILRMRGDRVWGVLADSSGVAYVARWRVEPAFQLPK